MANPLTLKTTWQKIALIGSIGLSAFSAQASMECSPNGYAKYNERHSSYYLDEEMFSLHSANLTQVGFLLPGYAEHMQYLRGPGNLLRSDKNYLANVRAAHKDFEQWFEKFLESDSMTLNSWKHDLEQRHLIATGASTKSYHKGPSQSYTTHDDKLVFPGQLRSRRDKQGAIQVLPEIARSVVKWLERHGYDYSSSVSSRKLKFRGLDQLLEKKSRTLKNLNLEGYADLVSEKVQYPHDTDVDLFLELSWDRLNEIKHGIRLYRQMGAAQPRSTTKIFNNLQISILDSMADYYHTAITGHFFGKVNNSMLMPEVNTFLKHIGLKPVSHGSLDLVAIRMDYLPFREYFKQFVAHHQR